MSKRAPPAAAVLAAGVGMGFAGDFLMRAPGGPGLNVSLLFAGLAASVLLVSVGGGLRLSLEGGVWLAVGALCGTGLVWRGSELLRFLAFMAASLAFAVPAFRSGRGWVRRAGVADLCEAVAASGLHAVFGSVRLLQREPWEGLGSAASRGTAVAVARSALAGTLLAVVPLAVFGALFMSADRVFSGMVGDVVRVDLQSVASHIVVAGALSWLASGYLAGFATGTRLNALRRVGWVRPSLGVAEVSVALGLVDLLFLGFVIVQFRYLFGGQEWVEVTPGLTYAAYARQGFFHLVAATALGLPWLLGADALLSRAGGGRRVYKALAGVQLLLLLAIVGSAVQRMRAYLDAYGLTESRFVATAVLGWLAVLLVWFAATVLRGRRRSFAFGALVSGYGMVLLLQIADPASLAARSHLRRAPERTFGDPGVLEGADALYLASLGSDAAPVLAERIGRLDARGRCLVARSLLRRWGPDSPADWRSWNRADHRAREAVSAAASRLRLMVGEGERCGPGPEEVPAPLARSRDRGDTIPRGSATALIPSGGWPAVPVPPTGSSAMSRAFVNEDAGGDDRPRFSLPERDSPHYDEAAAWALIQGADEGDSVSAEWATGYRWGEPRLAPHVRTILEEAEKEGQDRVAQLARRFLRATQGEI